MSRSKEGMERQTTDTSLEQDRKPAESGLEQTLGSKGQTDYTPGRESFREFPRRSTSFRRSGGEYDNYAESYRRRGRVSESRTGRRQPGGGRSERGLHRLSRADERNRWVSERYEDPYYQETFSGQFGDFRAPHRERGYRDDDYWAAREEEIDRERPVYGRNYLRCEDIMTKDVTVCSPQTPLREVAEKMEDEDVGSIPVLEKGRLLGLVTDRDIVCRVIADGRETRTATAADAMSEDLVTCVMDEPIENAIRKMGEHQVRRLPICDPNGRLRGIVSMADIALEAERDRELAYVIQQISLPLHHRSRRI